MNSRGRSLIPRVVCCKEYKPALITVPAVIVGDHSCCFSTSPGVNAWVGDVAFVLEPHSWGFYLRLKARWLQQLLPKPPEGGLQLNRSSCPGVNAWARESLLGAVLAPVLLFRQFIRDFVCTKDLAQHFPHRAHVDRDRPVDRFVVDKITDQRLNVAVEDQADQLS